MDKNSPPTIKSTNISQQNTKSFFIFGSLLFFLAIAIGAFGAHALEKVLTLKSLKTFQTGNQYHYLIALSALILPGLSFKTQISLRFILPLQIFSFIFFSLGCYFYALTQIKAFALIVPFGGTAFLISWFLVLLRILREKA